MELLRDHPDVESALSTGYPTWNQPENIYCEECDRDITEETIYEDSTHEYLCKDCLLNLHEKWW